MPETSAAAIALSGLLAAVAALAAWLARGRRSAREKQAINAGWKDRLEALQAENHRLEQRTGSLMEQVGQYQASSHDAKRRARELADSLREATDARDRLQRQLKEIRGNLEHAVAQRDRLHTDVEGRDLRRQAVATELKQRDQRIARLKRDLASWHERLPPLVERYRERDREAQALETELERVRARVAELEAGPDADDTRMEPDTLRSGLDASNDQYDETSQHDMAAFEDQPLMSDGFDGYPRTYSSLTEHDGPERDDLKRIKGVGPAIEQILNELGFYRFEQIANLSRRDIVRIGERLHGFGSRIERDDWVGQARLLDCDR